MAKRYEEIIETKKKHSQVEGPYLRSPASVCKAASRKGIQLRENCLSFSFIVEVTLRKRTHVDMWKSAALNKPNMTNPRTAEPSTHPATLNRTNKRKMMAAKAALDRRSLILGSFDGGGVLEPIYRGPERCAGLLGTNSYVRLLCTLG